MIKPGPRLDALVAEKVFGCTPYIGPSAQYECGCSPMNPEHETMINSWCVIPKYSTSIADAWQVVEKIEKDFAIQISSDGDAKIIWYCYLENEDKGVWVNEKADTAPHAICLAALKAIGVEV